MPSCATFRDEQNFRAEVLTRMRWTSLFLVVVLIGLVPMAGLAADEQPIDVIEDNSFLIEEAYNQEAGVVQHIFSALYNNDSQQRGWTFNFTQEWPVFSQDHQFSYSIPSYHYMDGEDRIYGIGDLMLNYRYQALYEGELQPAFAPRFSLILPTGSRRRGTGNNVVGYQWNLPLSKKLGSRLAVHANWGLTYLPHVRSQLDSGTRQLSPPHSLVSYNLGASGIWALTPRFHLMLEWLGIFEQSINDSGKATRSFQPILSPGFRAAVINEEKLQVVVGAAMPVGLNRNADNLGAFLYLSIEHSFLPR